MFLQRDAGRDGGHLSRASVASVGHTDLCPAARFNMSALSLSSSAHCLNTGQSHLETGCEIQHAQRNMRTLYSHPDWLFLHRSGFLPHTLQIRVLSTDREQRSLRLILSSVMQNGYTFKTESITGANYYNRCLFKANYSLDFSSILYKITVDEDVQCIKLFIASCMHLCRWHMCYKTLAKYFYHNAHF